MNQQRRDEIAAMTVATEPGDLVAALEEAMEGVDTLLAILNDMADNGFGPAIAAAMSRVNRRRRA
jgi:hypothetical protein